MNPELQHLKDIHLPQPISMWPIAPGWIFLLALLMAALFYLIYFAYKAYRKKYTVKFALAKLKKLQLENPDDINIAAEISTLLRRTALHYFPRENIAGLSGKRWLEFLNRSGDTTNFTQEAGHLLTDVPYQKENITDLTPLFDLARAWFITISKKNAMSAEK